MEDVARVTSWLTTHTGHVSLKKLAVEETNGAAAEESSELESVAKGNSESYRASIVATGTPTPSIHIRTPVSKYSIACTRTRICLYLCHRDTGNVSELMEKDKDDESLNEYKKKLLGMLPTLNLGVMHSNCCEAIFILHSTRAITIHKYIKMHAQGPLPQEMLATPLTLAN